MERYKVIYSTDFATDIRKHKKSGQKKLIEKIYHLLEEIALHPTTGTGKVEVLRYYGERSVWSRRINTQHRLTYEILEKEKLVEILACWGHYDDH